MFTREIDHEKIYENIIVEKTFVDGEQCGWTIVPNDGYKLYRTSANDTTTDRETMIDKPITKYFDQIMVPMNYNWAHFDWKASAI